MNSTRLNQQSYNKITDAFTSDRKTSLVPNEVVEFANLLKPEDRVLDLGCGGGIPNALYLVKQNLKVTGIDISETMIQEAIKNVPQAEFKQSDITEFYSDQQFEGILAWDSLFHLEPNEHEAAFQKIYSLLKVNGFFLFTHGGSEGQIQGEMYGESFAYSSPGPGKIKEMLQKLGFKIVKWELDNSEENGYLKVLMQK